MEPAGLAVGLLGLAGLFNTCLEVVNKYDAWKSFGADLRSLTAQFETQKIRLERWGEAVGIERDGLSCQHHKLLDDPRILSNVRRLLSSIKDSCGFEDNICSETVSGKPDHTGPPRGLRRQRLNWALRNKEKRIAQITQFSSMVDDLHNLVPVQARDVLANQAPWVFDLNQVLAGMEREKEAERRRDIQGWLLGDHCQNELYDVYVKRSVEGSCKWVLDRPWFLKWSSVDFPSRTAKHLWINGPAGFGKSILCAKVIQYLLTSLDTPVAYFLCDSETRSPSLAVRFWLSQLVSHEKAFGIVRGKWETTEAKRATRRDIFSLLQEIVSAVHGCTLVLDGLDECEFAKGPWPVGADDSIPNFLGSLRRATKDTFTRVLIMSRNEPEIRYGLMDSGPDDDVFEHQITPDDVREDVAAYSRSVVNEKLPRKPQETKDDITKRLAESCNGQFLWVRLQQETLRGGKSQRKLEEAISSTPPGIEHFYERDWKRIMDLPDEDRTRAFSILHWTAFSVRPLTVSETSGALVVGDDSEKLQLGNLPDIIDEEYISTEITQLCGSLLEVRDSLGKENPGWKTLHLAHFSVKEYMLRKIPARWKAVQLNAKPGQSTEAIESMVLARKCLRVVNSQEAWFGNSTVGAEDAIGAFRTYAAVSWWRRAMLRDMSDPELVNSINRFFNPVNPNWNSWKVWFDREYVGIGKHDMEYGEETTSPVYYAAWLELEETVKYLIQERICDVNSRGYYGETSLQVASRKGNLQIVKALLDHGAAPSLADMEGLSPVGGASIKGHMEIVKLLTEFGADTNNTTNCGWTPIHLACLGGHTEAVRLLIQRGADVNVTNKGGRTPLFIAAGGGHTEVVETLIQHGADVNIADNDGWTPINCTAGHGYTEVVRALLQHGARVNIANNNGWTPLNSAGSHGHTEVVETLLDHGADVSVPNTAGLTPLYTAAASGHLDVLKLLLECGADIETRDSDGATPLMRNICRGGPTEVAKLLLTHGADIEAKDNIGDTPLVAAALENKAEIARMLLEWGADTTAKGYLGRTPIMCASLCGGVETIELFQQKHADVADADDTGRISLHYAACSGRIKSAEILLQLPRIEVDAVDKTNQTPLFMAAARGHLSMVDTLLAHNADPNCMDRYNSTPLCAATRNGHGNVVKRLIMLTDDPIDRRDAFGKTLLWWASNVGETNILATMHDWASKHRVEADDGDFCAEPSTTTLAKRDSNRVCDVCTRYLCSTQPYYSCDVCIDFDICLECFEMGMQCLSSSHEWTHHQPKRQVL